MLAVSHRTEASHRGQAITQLLDLPDALLEVIIGPLPLVDQARVQGTCRRLRRLIDELPDTGIHDEKAAWVGRQARAPRARRRLWPIPRSRGQLPAAWAEALGRVGLPRTPARDAASFVKTMSGLADMPEVLARVRTLSLGDIAPRRRTFRSEPARRQWLDGALDLLVSRAPNLTALDLHFRDNYPCVLPAALAHLPRLERLSLRGADGARLAPDDSNRAWRSLTRLSWVDGSTPAAALGAGLRGLSGLRALRLTIGTGPESLCGVSLAQALARMTSLTELHLDVVPSDLLGSLTMEHPTLSNIHLDYPFDVLQPDLSTWAPRALQALTLGASTSAWPSVVWDLTQLTYLRLEGSERQRELPAALGGMIRLRELWCAHAPDLWRVDVALTRLIHLETLSLEDLSSLTSLPNGLADLPCLRRLRLVNLPELTSFPWEVFGRLGHGPMSIGSALDGTDISSQDELDLDELSLRALGLNLDEISESEFERELSALEQQEPARPPR